MGPLPGTKPIGLWPGILQTPSPNIANGYKRLQTAGMGKPVSPALTFFGGQFLSLISLGDSGIQWRISIYFTFTCFPLNLPFMTLSIFSGVSCGGHGAILS